MTAATVTFTIPGAAGEALQIDSLGPHGLWPDTTVQAKRHGKGCQYVITTTRATAELMQGHAHDRATQNGGEGFDQPRSWVTACRRTAEIIRKELAPVSTPPVEHVGATKKYRVRNGHVEYRLIEGGIGWERTDVGIAAARRSHNLTGHADDWARMMACEELQQLRRQAKGAK